VDTRISRGRTTPADLFPIATNTPVAPTRVRRAVEVTSRLAEDGTEHLDEADRTLDALELVLVVDDADPGLLALVAKARRHLSVAVVERRVP
jgi:hypothetical protein